MVLIFLRSLVFNILFYVVFLFWALVGLPTFVLPRSAMLKVGAWWAKTNILLMRAICGIEVEFRGVEKIPKGPLIVASKHQSMWETISLLRFFEAPFFVIKRELKFIPIFGLFMIKTDMVAIDRQQGWSRAAGRAAACRGGGPARAAVRDLPRRYPHRARRAAAIQGRCWHGVCGLRRAGPAVALNSGLFWPRRTFMRYPGTLVVEFLDPSRRV